MISHPISTYRLQISPNFQLDLATAQLDYLTNLGADWVYLSPILTAEIGSDHGYDVTDHSQVDPQRGGRDSLQHLSDAAHQRGLGVLVDIVPNHIGVATPTQAVWWWDLLQHGQSSRYAEAFDIDWEFGAGRVRVPILGDGDNELEALTIVDGELRYYDHRLPIAAGTNHGTPQQVHDKQHFELVNWRRADAELNYRRFFAVSTLAAIRVEVPAVFAESHAEILRWIRSGLADGLRVDHPDGLYDPARYLDELAAATGGAYVLVEKILEGDEPLPADWKCAGTTGYDALTAIDRVLIDPAGEVDMTALDAELRGGPVDWHEMIHDTKRGIADGILRSEVLRLTRLAQIQDSGIDEPEEAVAELLATFPVYRSYLATVPAGDGPREVVDTARDGAVLQEALDSALAHRPDLAESLVRVAQLLRQPDLEISRRFQQTSGMVMAKGVEDTAFYRFTRLTSLNEVGADPNEFSIPVAKFHQLQQQRQTQWPHSMITTSTHDTKRSEDVRARLAVLAEMPQLWVDAVHGWQQNLAEFDLVQADGPLTNMLWQATVGAWPISRERLHAYAEKASREAGNSTNWWYPNTGLEEQLHAMIDLIFDDLAVRKSFEDVVHSIAPAGWSNSLATKLIALTVPGMPDVYQGTELWDYSLVDPDNRRPVDYETRRRLLSKLDDGFLPDVDDTGAAKLLVTSRALRLRRDSAHLFTGYAPISATGDAAEHLVSFDRGGAITVATRLPVGLATRGGWGDTRLPVPADGYTNVLTEEFIDTSQTHEISIADLFARYPVALIIPAEGSSDNAA